MQAFALIRPHTLAAARQRVLAQPEARLLRAGGVDLLDRMKEGLESPDELVELASLQGELGQQLRALRPSMRPSTPAATRPCVRPRARRPRPASATSRPLAATCCSARAAGTFAAPSCTA